WRPCPYAHRLFREPGDAARTTLANVRAGRYRTTETTSRRRRLALSINTPVTIDRRFFLRSTGLVAAAWWLAPDGLFAQHEGYEIVNLMRAGAATAGIDVP